METFIINEKLFNKHHVQSGRIVAISTSKKKGIPKSNVSSAQLIEEYGIDGDAHAGNWHRQVSFLAMESITTMREKVYRNFVPVLLRKILQQNLSIFPVYTSVIKLKSEKKLNLKLRR